MDDLGDLSGMLSQVERMMKNQVTTDVVTKVIDMYDDFATTALKALMVHTTAIVVDADSLAKSAWAIADAMMEERKKRGLGGMPG